MYQFDENDRKWHKCSLTRGLLFGQRVFQKCLTKTVKELSFAERFALVTEMMQKCPEYGLKTKQSAMFLLADKELFAKVLKIQAFCILLSLRIVMAISQKKRT